MKKLIVISGDLAAGKSTLADNLSKKLNIASFEKDTLKEKLCEIFDFKTRDENRRLSIAAVDEMIDIFDHASIADADLILEANFRTSELKRLKKIADAHNYDCCLLLLTGDTKVLYQRFLDRIPTRHRAHMSMGLDKDYSKYVEYIEALRNQNFVFEVNNIDVTNLDEYDVLFKALDILKEKHII